MDFDQGTISKHLALQAQQYLIPDFQRAYSWTSAEWRTLWVDALRQYKEVAPGWEDAGAEADIAARTRSVRHVPTHYLGTIVTANPVTVTPPRSTVIDGQQRLLTMWVLLLACRDLALKRIGRTAARESDRQAVKSRFASYLSNIGHPSTAAWRIVPQSLDQAAFRHLMRETREPGTINVSNIGLSESDSAGLLDAYNYFNREMARRRLPDSAPFEMAPFQRLYPLDPDILEYVLMNRLQAIKLVAGPTDDPNMIFESLNTKGRDLQQVDLIKNFLYLSLDEDADEVYRSYWRPMEHLLRPAELEKYAWASLVSRGENVLQKRTYEAVQRRLRLAGVDDTKAYVVELYTEAVWFERLIRPSKEPNAHVRRALEDVFAAGGSTALPLILYCYRRYQSAADATAFTGALSAIESFLVRRMIAGEGTNNLNSIFGTMCSRINTDSRYAPTDDLDEDVRRVLGARPADWPTDEDVTRGVSEVEFYRSQSARQRIHVLRRIDQRAGNAGVALQYEISDKSIEHIAPQGADAPDWKDAYDPGEWEAITRRVHTLPNLTLLTPAENSALGWRGWIHKRQAYASCGYPMTRAIAEQFSTEPWGVTQLDGRAGDLATVLVGIWPRELAEPHAVVETDRDHSTTAEALDDEPEEEGEVFDSLLDAEAGDALGDGDGDGI